MPNELMLGEKLGLGDAVAALSEVLGKPGVPEKYKPLLLALRDARTGAGKGVVTWTIPIGSQSVPDTKGYKLNLGASAEVTLDPGATWPDGDSAALLAIGASGKIEATGSATLPYSFGSVTADASANAQLALKYYFRAADTAIYGAAVAESVAQLPAPFDFDSVRRGLGSGDLEGLAFDFTGAANVSVEASVGDAFALGRGVNARLGATFKVATALADAYSLSLQKASFNGGPAIKVRLSRKPETTSSFSFALGAEIDPGVLTKPVADVLSRAMAEWSDTLRKLTPFLSPATELRTRVEALLKSKVYSLIAQADIRDAVIAGMSMALGTGTSDPAAWLEQQISGAIDRSGALAQPTLVTANVIARLTKAVPALANVVQQPLEDAVQEILQQLQSALRDIVGELLAVPGDALKKALGDAGIAVDAAVKTVDQALAPVRAFIAKVSAKFEEILQKTQDALKQKITARLSSEETTATGEILEVVGTIYDGPDGRTAFEALVLGDLGAVIALIERAGPLPGFAFEKGEITRFTKQHGKRGLEISFLNIQLESYKEFFIAAVVTVDVLGNVHVTTQGKLDKVIRLPFLNTKREATFVESYALVQAGLMQAGKSAGPPVLELGVGASFEDDTLDAGSVAAFVSQLETLGLVAAGAGTIAKSTFAGWAKGGPSIYGGISASVRATGSGIETLLRIGDRDPSGALTAAARQSIVRTALGVLRRIEHGIDAAQFDDGCALTGAKFFPHPTATPSVEEVVLNFPDRFNRQYQLRIAGTSVALGNSPYSVEGERHALYFMVEAIRLARLADLIDTMGHIYLATAGAGVSAWDASHYAQAEAALIRDSDSWVTADRPLLNLGQADIAARMLVFLRTLADLSGLVGKPAMQVTMTYWPKDKPEETKSFG